MIAIDRSGKLVTVSVLGEFVLADYKEFEDMVRSTLVPGGKVNLLIDLRQMAPYGGGSPPRNLSTCSCQRL